MFHSTFYRPYQNIFNWNDSSDIPNYSAIRVNKGLRIVVPLVGCGKEDIDIKYKSNIVSITYDKAKCKGDGSKHDPVTFDIEISGNFSLNSSKAKIENGLLLIDIPDSFKSLGGVIQLE